MKLYCITEGKTEKKVFKHWIPFVLHGFKYCEFINIDQIRDNEFTIVNGGGFNKTFSLIPRGIDDVNEYAIDRLLIQIDADENPVNEVLEELQATCKRCSCTREIHFIVTKPCFEAWCLGNMKFPKRNPIDDKARIYLNFYNVLKQDPELIPRFEELNSSQFAFDYLRALCRDRSLIYNKNNPKIVCDKYFFDQIHSRFNKTKHISTFEMFLKSLQN